MNCWKSWVVKFVKKILNFMFDSYKELSKKLEGVLMKQKTWKFMCHKLWWFCSREFVLFIILDNYKQKYLWMWNIVWWIICRYGTQVGVNYCESWVHVDVMNCLCILNIDVGVRNWQPCWDFFIMQIVKFWNCECWKV